MHLRKLLFSVIALPFTATVFAQNPLDSVLIQLNSASEHFKNAQANVKYDNFTKVVHDDEKQTGTMFIERTGNSQQFGAVFFEEGHTSKTPAQVINFDGATLHAYNPGTNVDDIIKAGANHAKYESFLTLGFGGSGKALQQAWNITDQGSETIDGVKTEKLDLVSKDPSVAKMLTHVTIWVDPARGVSLKQITYAPSGDTKTAEYSNIKINGSIDKKPYAINKKATQNVH